MGVDPARQIFAKALTPPPMPGPFLAFREAVLRTQPAATAPVVMYQRRSIRDRSLLAGHHRQPVGLGSGALRPSGAGLLVQVTAANLHPALGSQAAGPTTAN